MRYVIYENFSPLFIDTTSILISSEVKIFQGIARYNTASSQVALYKFLKWKYKSISQTFERMFQLLTKKKTQVIN